MFIESLKVEHEKEVIRYISFHRGLNLIIDETPSNDKKKSGNNVGKTTVLRLIDFCLSGKGDNIYKDPEFKGKGNTLVENFLKNNEVSITLTLASELNSDSANKIVIERNFLKRKSKIQRINGTTYNNGQFAVKLKELIFNSTQNKPTFRQIIAKNIRDEKNRLQHTVKVLHSSTTQDEYESLYLYWFGIELAGDSLEKKQRLLSEIRLEKSVQKQLGFTYTLPQIEQLLQVVNRKIQELEKEKDSYSYNDDFESELTSLNMTKAELNSISGQLSRLELRKELIIESRNDLEKEIAEIDTTRIRRLYDEASALIPTIQKTFDETLKFHNEMVKEKLSFITEELPSLDNEIGKLKKALQFNLNKEKTLADGLIKVESNRSWKDLVNELNSNYEKKGSLEESKKLWETSNALLQDKLVQLEVINSEIQSKDASFKSNITRFNTFFSDISSKLYNEQFVLSPDNNEKGYELNISSLSGNLGTGKKKGQIASFDLAYIQFAEAIGLNCLHFILHDQIENVHDNQISKLLTEIVASINCQYIIPVLRDKLPTDIKVDEFKVLSLSQDNKLFKI